MEDFVELGFCMGPSFLSFFVVVVVLLDALFCKI